MPIVAAARRPSTSFVLATPRTRAQQAPPRFFGVSPTYFFPDPETERGAIPAEVALALADDEVREIALRAAGLPERPLKAIRDMIDSARALNQPQGRRRAQRRRAAGQ